MTRAREQPVPSRGRGTPSVTPAGSGSDPGSAGWTGARVCVAGIGVSGVPAARALLRAGASVTVVDDRDGERESIVGRELSALGASVRLGRGQQLPGGTELVVTSPGWHPDAPLLRAAAGAGVEVIGEVELAWRMRPGPDAAPWLALTGTNGKTTTVRMLASILTAAGYRATATGNVGASLLEAVLADPPYEVLAVELSSFQLHWSRTVRPSAAAVLNVAPDHLDWHGSFDAYAADKGRVFAPGTLAVCNADDPVCVRLASGSDRRVSFTLDEPHVGQLGVVEGGLLDRAFGDARVADVADLTPAAPHNVANALAATALARAHGVGPDAVRAGLRCFRPDSHRVAEVATIGGVRYVDDSKATNPHAAAASLSAYPRVVWIAGGQLKGANVDDVVAAAAGRLRGAVLLGADRGVIRAAFERHAPQVPLIEVASTQTGAMQAVVREAAGLAQPGDTVLLAPAGASFDMFDSYAARGDAFAAAVRLLAGESR